MLYNISESLIDGNGESSIYGLLEEPKLNKRGLLNGVKAFDITNNHKKQTATISTFIWLDGSPHKWEVVKTLKEIIDKSEVEVALKGSGVI